MKINPFIFREIWSTPTKLLQVLCDKYDVDMVECGVYAESYQKFVRSRDVNHDMEL